MNEKEHSHVTSFGYELIRDHVLTSILGKHEKDILYWAGKDLARKFPTISYGRSYHFFQRSWLGHFNLRKLQKILLSIRLRHIISSKWSQSRSHRLEAGFLAEQQQKIMVF